MKYIGNGCGAFMRLCCWLRVAAGIKGNASELAAAEPMQEGVSDSPVKIGEPYTVGNKNYKPEDVAAYDEVGYASWYGDELKGDPQPMAKYSSRAASAARIKRCQCQAMSR